MKLLFKVLDENRSADSALQVWKMSFSIVDHLVKVLAEVLSSFQAGITQWHLASLANKGKLDIRRQNLTSQGHFDIPRQIMSFEMPRPNVLAMFDLSF